MDQDSKEAALSYRQSLPDDLNFIRSSWGSSYFMNNSYNKAVSADVFHKRHKKLRDEILERPTTQVLVACATDSPELIVGYVVTEALEDDVSVIHYLYVKEAFKGEKIATELFKRGAQSKRVIITHLTQKASNILHQKKKQLGEYFYIPFLAL